MIEFFVKLLLILGSYAFLYWTFAYALEQGKLIYQKEAKEKEEAQHQQISETEEQYPKKKDLPIHNPFEEP